ncbi:MAG TPA: LuxR C-terminal-related transcriptional regulator [Gemmatimonadales bacterium]|nr:LuxR C-terminal-related transcriptional regulator [Gemmatimonadales bacterium]
MDQGEGARLRLPLALLMLVFAAGVGVDLVLDQPAHWLSFHVGYELLLAAGALAAAAWLWRGWRRAEREGAALRRSLAAHRAERDAWRANAEQALAGLARAIDRQFESWGLTPAEREVALQLLKGRSHKEIAAATGRSERTVRQHAAAAYQKAGLDGRAALAAFFLEGLMLPGAPPAGSARASA